MLLLWFVDFSVKLCPSPVFVAADAVVAGVIAEAELVAELVLGWGSDSENCASMNSVRKFQNVPEKLRQKYWSHRTSINTHLRTYSIDTPILGWIGSTRSLMKMIALQSAVWLTAPKTLRLIWASSINSSKRTGYTSSASSPCCPANSAELTKSKQQHKWKNSSLTCALASGTLSLGKELDFQGKAPNVLWQSSVRAVRLLICCNF